MRLPRIGALILGSFRLLECLLEHHLVEELGGEILHAALQIGEIICNKCEGIHGSVSPLSKSRLDSRPFYFHISSVTLPVVTPRSAHYFHSNRLEF